jgi:prephenate dehydratase
LIRITDNVLRELQTGSIDRGQFAIENSIAGQVKETLIAQEKYSFDSKYKVIDRYSLKVGHCLMLHPGSRLEEVDTIMTHPNVLAQCRNNIAQRYPWMKLIEGEGDLIDPSKVGGAIAVGLLPKNVATISNSLIAEIQGLKIADQNLQDRDNNFTTFVFVSLR